MPDLRLVGCPKCDCGRRDARPREYITADGSPLGIASALRLPTLAEVVGPHVVTVQPPRTAVERFTVATRSRTPE